MLNNIQSSMRSPHLENDHPLRSLLEKASGIEKAPTINEPRYYWDQNHYQLNRTSFFTDLPEEKQQEAILRLNHWSLSLAYYIEKFGLNYGAKQILLSETVEEKSLYAIFTEDEARHRLLIENHLFEAPPSDLNFHPLLPALNLCLVEGTRDAMIYTIQVVLEGFGLAHYTALKESCLVPSLKNGLEKIVADEALHHGMGLILKSKMKLTPESKNQIKILTDMFLKALKSAEWNIKTLEIAHGGLTENQKKIIRDDLRWQETINMRDERLSRLLIDLN